MFSGMLICTVVKLMDDENQDVCVISREWVSEDETHEYTPKVDGGKFHRLLRSHALLTPDTPKRPMNNRTRDGGRKSFFNITCGSRTSNLKISDMATIQYVLLGIIFRWRVWIT
ncbi:hypothetical protein FGIG_01216 [Fasciola gigantica]|uniref:Uncharacterized protein n=1 Tax=Fasciola gigantica TaxID=46835 RepID=A0A504YGH5_FASGI|nr:hypothetical protein FGIG_01216 [Fasciola gigantica]